MPLLGDASWNTFPNTILGVYWPDNAEAAFANLKFWQSVGSILPFALGQKFELPVKLEFMGSVLTLGVICLIILHVFVAPLGAKTKREPINA